MLLLRVIKTMHWSASPWNEMKRLPVGSTVKFVETFEPHNPKNDHCHYHGDNVEACRHIILEAFDAQFRTNVCMEEARLYFVIVDHDHEDLLP